MRDDVGVTTVALGLGIITFDGEVVELFGFGEQGSRRVHVGQIRSIEGGSGGLKIDVERGGVGIRMGFRASDEEQQALAELVAEVRGAMGQ
jgi:hypothetical protein